MSAMICASLCACGDNGDTKTETTETTTQVSTTVVETEAVTEAVVEETQAAVDEDTNEEETQVVAEDSNEEEAPVEENNQTQLSDAAFQDLEGSWEHCEKGDNNKICVTCVGNDTMYLTITAVRGEAAQIAEANVETVIEGDKGTFTYEDSFGNKGEGYIIVNNGETLTLSVTETENANNWGIRASSGEYVRG